MQEFSLGLCAHPGDVAFAAQAGFDYLELDLNEVARMEEDAYRAMAAQMQQSGVYAEVVCGLLPPDLPILGAHVSAHAIHAQLSRSFELARALGAEMAVFDSPQARVLPRNLDPAIAWRQLGNFVRILQGYAADNAIPVALLPLRRSAADLINYVSEASLISAMLRLDRVGVAASSYNMALEAETLPRLRNTGSLLWHMRTCNVLGRLPPREGDGEDYRALFETLREINYSGRVSCEARCESVEVATQALNCLRAAQAAR